MSRIDITCLYDELTRWSYEYEKNYWQAENGEVILNSVYRVERLLLRLLDGYLNSSR